MLEKASFTPEILNNYSQKKAGLTSNKKQKSEEHPAGCSIP